MAESLNNPTLAPNDFLALLSEYVAAKVKEESASGTRRSIKGRFEKIGAHKGGLDLFLNLRKLEPAEAELTLVSALRYCRWANMPLGSQAQLFSDDAAAPSEKATAGWTEAQAYEEGYKAGLAGRDANDTRFTLGSPLHHKHHDGWQDGQRDLCMQLFGREPADGEHVKKGAKGEKKQAAKKGSTPVTGRPRGRRSSRAGAGL